MPSQIPLARENLLHCINELYQVDLDAWGDYLMEEVLPLMCRDKALKKAKRRQSPTAQVALGMMSDRVIRGMTTDAIGAAWNQSGGRVTDAFKGKYDHKMTDDELDLAAVYRNLLAKQLQAQEEEKSL
jgi:hypothetical protein